MLLLHTFRLYKYIITQYNNHIQYIFIEMLN